MMSYIDRNLLPNEQIIFRTKKHMIIFFIPVVLTVLTFYVYSYMSENSILVQFTWIPGVVTFLFWSYACLEYFTSDFAVTNKRVMMREGFFHRHANELRLSAISQVNVDQSLLGQILNYGVVTLNAFGAFDTYAGISRPLRFQRAVNEQVDRSTSD